MINRKNIFWLIIIFFIILTAVIIISLPQSSDYTSEKTPEVKKELVGPHIKIKEKDIKLELATTTKDVEKGLSGRISLENNSGMLFVFSKPYRYSFWMRDMNFPLDMIWINDGLIVDISENVPNDFNPASPTFYQPLSPAQYVLEVNAGFSGANNIKIGDAVSFININL